MIMTKRYELVWIGGTESEMQESAYGDWVKAEDYDALQSLNAELLEALELILLSAKENKPAKYWLDGARAVIAKARSQA
jgi:hypothetical protein